MAGSWLPPQFIPIYLKDSSLAGSMDRHSITFTHQIWEVVLTVVPMSLMGTPNQVGAVLFAQGTTAKKWQRWNSSPGRLAQGLCSVPLTLQFLGDWLCCPQRRLRIPSGKWGLHTLDHHAILLWA